MHNKTLKTTSSIFFLKKKKITPAIVSEKASKSQILFAVLTVYSRQINLRVNEPLKSLHQPEEFTIEKDVKNMIMSV